MLTTQCSNNNEEGDVNSWNLRDIHMMDTLERLVSFFSSNNPDKSSKVIVWAHNTHVRDARFTDMVPSGLINIGQLVREKRCTEYSLTRI